MRERVTLYWLAHSPIDCNTRLRPGARSSTQALVPLAAAFLASQVHLQGARAEAENGGLGGFLWLLWDATVVGGPLLGTSLSEAKYISACKYNACICMK